MRGMVDLSQFSVPEIFTKLIVGDLYSILCFGKRELLIYKGLGTSAKIVSTSSTQRFHDFIYIGPETPIPHQEIIINPKLASHTPNFLNEQSIKTLINISQANPEQAALMMVFSPYFGYQFGAPQKIKGNWSIRTPADATKRFYYINKQGTCSGEIKDLNVLNSLPQGTVVIHRPAGSIGPSAQYIINGGYNPQNIKILDGFIKKEGYLYNGGKSKKNFKKYKSKTKRN